MRSDVVAERRTGPRHICPESVADLLARRVALQAERAHLDAVDAAIVAELAARAARLDAENDEEPWTAQQVATYLNVGVDWVRDHGAELKLERRYSTGTVRYDPDAVRQLRRNGRPDADRSTS